MDNLKEYLEEYQETPHYYGNTVRALFILAGLIMLISLPIFRSIVPFPIVFSVLIVLSIGFLAGLTNPKVIWIIAIDAIASFTGFIVFEYMAIIFFEDQFYYALVNQLLAIIFFLTIYFSTKTLRGLILRKKG